MNKVNVIEFVEKQKTRDTDRFIAETRSLRKRITQTTGKWDAVEVLRKFRYAHK